MTMNLVIIKKKDPILIAALAIISVDLVFGFEKYAQFLMSLAR
jgi:hypothetical protein